MSDSPVDESRLLGILGLALKAGRLIIGTDMVCASLREAKKGQMPLLILEASDNSTNTHKKLSDKSSFYNTKLIMLNTDAHTLGERLGRGRSVACCAVTDAGFVAAIVKFYKTVSPALR